MKVLLIRMRSIKIALFSIAVIVLNFSLHYLIADDLNRADLSILAGRRIAIDPGHGGIDAGASWNATVEKGINLAISLKLAEVLKNNGATVILTRESDTDYYTRGKGGKRSDLLKRVDIIENSGAEVFVSIHANAIKGTRWTGAQVFYNPKFEINKRLAEIIQRHLREFPPGNKRQAKQDSEIIVLNANIPGVLVETGYLSNPQEAAKLADSHYQQKLAEQIARGLAYHFSEIAGR